MKSEFPIINGKKMYQGFLCNTTVATKENLEHEIRNLLSLKNKLMNWVRKLDNEYERLNKLIFIFLNEETKEGGNDERRT